MNIAIVAAAGKGRRLNQEGGKQYIHLAGKPLLAYAVGALQKSANIDGIIIVTGSDKIDTCRRDVVDKFNFDKVISIVAGGEERQESIYLGLRTLSAGTKKVCIHDGARPLVKTAKIDEVIEACGPDSGAIMAVPVKDTVKVVERNTVVKTLERNMLWLAQTPQVFPYEAIIEAHELARKEGFRGTDDAALMERSGHPVKIIIGDYDNIKITNPADLIIAEALLKGGNIFESWHRV